MQDTVDPAASPPRTLAQIIEDARRAVCGLYRSKTQQAHLATCRPAAFVVQPLLFADGNLPWRWRRPRRWVSR